MPIRVLIVDDIAETRDNVRRLLSLNDEFMVVGEASNGKLALEQVEKLRPDIILMDINMPEMDGITACKFISSLYPQCSVIMMTVQGGLEYVERSLEVGARDYITKPFSSQELMVTIKNAYHSCSRPGWVVTSMDDFGGVRSPQYRKRRNCIKKEGNAEAQG